MVQRLSGLEPDSLEIVDESERHIGHKGSGGGGHFRMTIVSEHFSGKSRVARHRLVYDLLSDLMKGEIHALALNAYTPCEYHLKQPT